MEEFLGLRYRLVKKENFSDLLNFLGKNILERTLAEALRPIQSVTKNEDGTYVLHCYSALVKYDTVFIPGVEFVDNKPDRSTFRTVITIEDNKVIQKETDKRGRTLTHVYEFFPDQMIVTTTADELEKTVILYHDRVK